MKHPALRTLGGAVGAAALLVTAACAPSSSSSADSSAAPSGSASAGTEEATGDPVTLSVWSWRTEDVDTYNEIFDVYEAEHPNVTIDFEAFQNTEYNQILTTGLAGSDGPDVPMVRSYGLLQTWVDAGQLEPLDDLVTGLDGLDPTVRAGALGKADGQLYGVPLATQTTQVFYNKDIFDQLGLSEPTTWDEFVSVNQTLKDNGITPIALGAKDAWVLPMFTDIVAASRYGGSEFEADLLSGAKKFTDPDYVAALQVVDDLQQYMVDDVVGVSYSDSQVQFTTGQAAQFAGGSYELSTFRGQAPDLNIGVYQVPAAPDAVTDSGVTPAYADGNFALNAKSENKDAAVDLLNWMATPEFGQLVADKLNQFSAIPGVSYNDPLMQEMWDAFTADPAPYLLLVDFRYGTPSGTDVLGEGIQQMFMGQLDPAGVADKLQVGMDQWFTPSGS